MSSLQFGVMAAKRLKISPEEPGFDHFSSLEIHVLGLIFDHLNFADILSVRQACQRLLKETEGLAVIDFYFASLHDSG